MELWEQYADQFPVRDKLVYLNHAGVSPLCRRAADAMLAFTLDAFEWGSWHYDRWLAAYEGLRSAAARLIGSKPSEIAIVKNTSEGIAIFAAGIDWRPGDRVVAFREEFPANVFPWMRLEQQGTIQVTWLSYLDPLEVIDEACRGARLLSVSYVQYLSGYRSDLKALGEICARRGCLFFVDAIQGLGVFPLKVEECRISALASDGHKWLLGPEGCGLLFIREDLQESIVPHEFGWTNTRDFNDYASRDMTLRPGAARYECGTLNTIGCFGLQASIEFILEVGVANIGRAVQARADGIANSLANLDCELLGTRTETTGAGIVSFRKPGEHCLVTMRRMKKADIMAAPRQGWVRVSPHFYTAPRDAEALLETVAATE